MQETVLRKLTREEVEEVAERLAKLVPALSQLRDSARETAAEYRKEAKGIEAHIHELASEIRTGMREEIAQLGLPRIGKDEDASA